VSGDWVLPARRQLDRRVQPIVLTLDVEPTVDERHAIEAHGQEHWLLR